MVASESLFFALHCSSALRNPAHGVDDSLDDSIETRCLRKLRLAPLPFPDNAAGLVPRYDTRRPGARWRWTTSSARRRRSCSRETACVSQSYVLHDAHRTWADPHAHQAVAVARAAPESVSLKGTLLSSFETPPTSPSVRRLCRFVSRVQRQPRSCMHSVDP